ncbi:MAG TPA: NUDIX domain-containing protein [Dictyobacter sp.]|jgi:ADP-ribose pyrophosphatase YjhB (NUDIX family)|nr:NUDIX domain-containing protein [Dictyobacter sp.]
MKERFKVIIAVHLFLFRGDQILLSRRFQTGYEDGNYSVIAGHLEGNEEVTIAMQREAHEEAGIHIKPEQMEVIGVMHRKTDEERIDFFLAASQWNGEIYNAEPQKCDELAWFSLNNLPVNMIPYVRQALDNYQHGHWFTSFGWT